MAWRHYDKYEQLLTFSIYQRVMKCVNRHSQELRHAKCAVLEMRNIAKVFGKFYALKGVDLTVWPGEIHALMGENGAGKSTLMKILAGAYTATSGEILIDGTPHTIRGPKDALGAGITLIYQEMQLAPNLTVAENIFLGSEIARGGLVQRKTMAAQAQAVIDRLGANFSATDRVMKLTIAEQQQVEIARALHRNSRILVMDEPPPPSPPVKLTACLN